MSTIGIFYGSWMNNTKEAANRIKAELETLTNQRVDVFDIAHTRLKEMERFDRVLIGIPTWDIGNLQRDWESAMPQFADLNLSDRLVALFGCGDQQGYPDTFMDGIGILGHHARTCGATIVGYWPTQGYDFTDSLGVEDGQFIGLALDNDNQRKLTAGRIKQWAKQLVGEFGLG